MGRLTAVAFCAALGAAVWLVVDPGQALRWDNLVHNLPLTLEAFRQVAAGRLPAWNPYIWSGSPLLADPQSQALYPVMWLAYAIAGDRPDTAMRILFALHVAIGAGGMLLLARALGTSRAGAGLAATVFAVNPYSAYLATSFANEQATLAWLPWVAFAACRAAEGARPLGWVAFGALAAALGWAAGYPQLWLYSALATVVVVSAATTRGPWRGLACALAASIGGLALSLHQLLPFVSLWLGSERAELRSLEDFLRTALPVQSWPAIALPGLVASTEAAIPLVGNNWPYLGLPAVALALIALTRPNRLRLTPLILGAVALWLASGASGGLLPLLYDAVPGFGLLRGPYKLYSCTVVAVALLAGFGASDVQRAPQRWHALLLLAAAVVAVIAYPLLAPELPAPVRERFGNLQLASLLLGSGGAVALAAVILFATMRASPARRRAIGMTAVAATLFAFAPEFAVYAQPDGQRGGLTRSRALEDLRPLLAAGGRWHWAIGLLARPLHPDLRRVLGAYWQTEMTTGYSAFLDPGYGRAIGLEAAAVPIVTPGVESPISGRNRVLDVLSARQVVFNRRSRADRLLSRQQTDAGTPVYGLRHPVDDLLVAIRETALPRVRSVAALTSVEARTEAISAVQTGAIDPAAMASVETAEGPLPAVGGACRIAGVERRPDRVEVDVDCSAAAFLVFSERHDPGWSATIDDRPGALRRSYGLVLGLPVAAGKHRVVVAYTPVRFYAGAALSAFLAVGLAACVVLERRGAAAKIRDDNGGRAR